MTEQVLTGQALRDRVRQMQGEDKQAIARACGYVSTTKTGQERVKTRAFYNALLEAEGIDLEGSAPTGQRGRQLSHRAAVQKNGNIVIGAAYTQEMGLEPGDKFELSLKRKAIHLTRIE